MLDDAAYTALCSAVTLQSNEKGFFRNVADGMVETAGAEWLSRFATLRSNRERIAECLTNERIKYSVRQMMYNVREVYRGKSAIVSKQRRLEAEHLHRNGKTDKSLVMFTQSIVKAPSAQAEEAEKAGDNDPSLALALWGRSQIFYERKRSLHCVEDIKLSLREKLPEKFRLEAYLRLAECYASLRRFDEARITSSIVSRMMTAIGDDERWPEARARNHTIRLRLEELASTIGPSVNQKENDLAAEIVATLANGEHASLKRISSKLALAETKEAGRFFVAAQAIRTGDTLVVEEAYVSCLSVDRFGSHCHHCMSRLETAMPCSVCSAVAFCSLACRTRALDSYHKFECRYMDLLIGSGMSILCFAALRIVSQQSIAYFESVNLDDDVTADGGHPYIRIYSMVRHEGRRSAEDYFRRTLMAIFLSSVLTKSGYLDAGVGPRRDNATDFGSREMLIAVVLLRNLEVLQFNAHEISETVRSGNVTKTSSIGVGLYASASFFNHECFPAVTRFFRGTTLIVRAVRAVRRERVVGDCYGPVLDKFEAPERRRRLRARYWFECECEACLRDWPSAHRLTHFLRIRCGRCGVEMDDAQWKKGGRCVKCDADAADEYETASKDIDFLRNRLETAMRDATSEAIAEICDAVDALDGRVLPPHQIYRRVADTLTRYWSQAQPPAPAAHQQPSLESNAITST